MKYVRLLILLHSRYRKRLIIRVAKNSLFTVVCEVFLNATFTFLFFAVRFCSAAFYTSKRINTCVRLVANVVRWRWLSPVSQQCQVWSSFHRLRPKALLTIPR
ncbi:hypothetical protein CKO_02480 [Citrobacter koseri ATCC BAA-895]|uniref:Uncharacterized protein n=1 Tax=Citrobacter koseri (strain ATCC BAA-895 / CDC 4225-83 / SGSC4696) TaxID=290338 RepID=A8AJD4_CITK8|nr:hypothetical protein CKO_02480 [Citrobacter koseri ATCC BAA-895]